MKSQIIKSQTLISTEGVFHKHTGCILFGFYQALLGCDINHTSFISGKIWGVSLFVQ